MDWEKFFAFLQEEDGKWKKYSIWSMVNGAINNLEDELRIKIPIKTYIENRFGVGKYFSFN